MEVLKSRGKLLLVAAGILMVAMLGAILGQMWNQTANASAQDVVISAKKKKKKAKRVGLADLTPRLRKTIVKKARGPKGPAGPQGPRGTGISFNKFLNPNNVLGPIRIGRFEIEASADSTGTCSGIRVRELGGVSYQSFIGAKAAYEQSGNTSVDIVPPGWDKNQPFTIVSNDGRSSISGVVGQVTVSSRCIVTGFVTGS